MVLAGCTDAGPRSDDGHRARQQAVHGFGEDPEPDTAHPGVVITTNCTGTLIAPRVVLLAAHCETRVGQGCISAEDRVARYAEQPRVFVSPTGIGSLGELEQYHVTSIAVVPGAFAQKIGVCDQENPLAEPRCDDTQHLDYVGLRLSHDLLLYRIHVEPGQPEPKDLVPLTRVLTGIDDAASPTPYAVHLPLRGPWTSPPSWPIQVPATIVGWGGDDRQNQEPPTRLSGPVLWELDQGWEQLCEPLHECMTPLGGDCDNGHGWLGQRPLRVVRTDMVPGSGLLDGPSTDQGDSGGPLLVRGLGGSDEEMAVGVLSVSTTSPGQGNVLEAGLTSESYYAPTFSPDLGPWIEERLMDWDGDGALDEDDNCVSAYNPYQENCNGDAEAAAMARGETNLHGEPIRILGDACDPVPCPDTSSPPGGVGTVGCVGNATAGWSCAGRAIGDRFTSRPIGSHRLWQHAQEEAGRGFVVNNVATDARFCQDDELTGFNCMSPSVLRNDRLQQSATPATELNIPAQPYHRVSLQSDNGSSNDARGLTYPMDYGKTVADFRWRYADDEAFWNQYGKIPQPPPGADCYVTGGFGAGTCLSGVFWLHGETDIGNTTDEVGGVKVGINGDNLANHYWPWAPDEPFDYYMPGRGWRLPLFFLWRTLPDPQPLDEIDLWSRVRNRALPLVFDETTAKVYRIDDAGYGIDMTAAMSPGVLQRAADPGVRWLSPVEPSPFAGAGSLSPVAVLMSADGAALLDTVRVTDGGVALSREGIIDALEAETATTTGPEARTGYVALYSRIAGGVFVLGGRLEATGERVGDAWLGSLAGSWRQLELRGEMLGDVTAATYAFRDRKLWALDIKKSGWKRTMRLLRIDPSSGGLQVVASWPYLGLFQNQWLVVDRNGDVMVVASSRLLRSHLVVVVGDRDGRVRARRVHVGLGQMAEAPVVDPLGVTWFVRLPTGAMVPVRRDHDPGSACGLDELRKIR